MREGIWEPSDRHRPSPQLWKSSRGNLLGSIRSCRTPADAYRMEMRKRRFENRHEFSTLHGDPRNCAFWTSLWFLIHERLNRHYSTQAHIIFFYIYSYLQWQGHALHLDCTLSRLGNITMRGSTERIYTTTYYIPSSPIEVRAYYPGYYSKESWPKDNLEYSKFNFTTEYRLNQKRKGSPEQPRVYRHEFLQTRVLQTRVLTDTSFITWWL